MIIDCMHFIGLHVYGYQHQILHYFKVNLCDNEILDTNHCYIWYVTDKTSIKCIAFQLHACIHKTQKSKLSRSMAILLCRRWNSFQFKLIARVTWEDESEMHQMILSNFSSFSKWIFEIKRIESIMRYHN